MKLFYHSNTDDDNTQATRTKLFCPNYTIAWALNIVRNEYKEQWLIEIFLVNARRKKKDQKSIKRIINFMPQTERETWRVNGDNDCALRLRAEGLYVLAKNIYSIFLDYDEGHLCSLPFACSFLLIGQLIYRWNIFESFFSHLTKKIPRIVLH